MSLSFENIETNSFLIERNEFFSQFTSHELPNHYDANFILLHYNPTLLEFQLIEKMHLDYQRSIQQSHLHFYWPENTGLFMDVLEYLNEEGFKIGMKELLSISPKKFKGISRNEQIQIEIIEINQLTDFLTLNYNDDLTISTELADHKKKVYTYQFNQSNIQFLMASIDQQPVGSLVLISSEKYLEVDALLTDQQHRNKGVASMLLEFVMQIADSDNKEVILVADAEDTPKEMYLKQGFNSVSTQIQAQKVLEAE